MRTNLPKIYNPASQSKEELIQNFVVRTQLFKDIMDDIRKCKSNHTLQHYIIQGIRGQGKTTLLLRIAYEIENDPTLLGRMIPIRFNEEQYNITRLYKLWETVAEYLEDHGDVTGLYDKMQLNADEDDYEMRCYDLIKAELNVMSKRLILLIDNIDELFTKFTKKEAHRLREILTESVDLCIIGASSVSLEFHYDYGHPFYEFFRTPKLRGLNAGEVKTLLLNLGERLNTDRVREIVANEPGRIEAIRRITGGVIRTIIILYNLLVEDQNGEAYTDLEDILDQVTPIYKHRMDSLPAELQEIVDFIALSWDAVSTKEIAARTKKTSKGVSAQLKQLQKYNIIEKESTHTKNHLYRLSERFFNIWYLMRHGRKWDEKRVKFFVEFLQLWCDEKELAQKALNHISLIREKKAPAEYARLMTEVLSRTPIEKKIQHELITETRNYLEIIQPGSFDESLHSDIELKDSANEYLNSKDPQKAIRELEQIIHKSAGDLTTLGLLYLQSEHNIKNTENYWLQAVAKDHPDAMYNLAFLYKSEFKDFKNAEKYYLMAVEKDHIDAMFNLAILYHLELKEFKNAEKYYLMAREKDSPDAMFG
ncbi:MAG: hypothetical protein HQ510_04350, partial [Candidatus Marinimicrobia bacterium]|nr:hypothetical protein [Candidatus Neomarinimicrobiota bacterium]